MRKEEEKIMRLTHDEIKALKDKYDKKYIYSYSALNTFTTSPYEYYLQKIKKEPQDAEASIYASLGGVSHDCLEMYYTNQIKYEDMLDRFQDGWVANREVLGLKFNRSDKDMDTAISNKYYKDLEHFFKHHSIIPHKVECERHLHCLVGDNLMNGYADAIFVEDGNVHIIDFKTSSMFKDVRAKSYQLTLYAMCLMAMGMPRERIKIAFNFLKFTTVTISQANGEQKKRDIERAKIGTALKSNATMWLKKDKSLSQEDIDNYISDMIMYNTTELLPDEVRSKYIFEDCYVYVPLDEELVEECANYITTTIEDITARFKEYKESGYDESVWYDTPESVDEQSYYFANLCGYTAQKHVPYKMYLEKFNKEEEIDEEGQVEEAMYEEELKNKEEFGDMSWLKDLL